MILRGTVSNQFTDVAIDNHRMTLFGESAGGASVDFYNYAWTKDPIINGFIAQSGTAAMRPNPNHTVENSAWYNLTEKIGCGGRRDGHKTVECMRQLPHRVILKSLSTLTTSTNPLALLTQFGPVPDGKVIFTDYQKRAAEGNFIKRVSASSVNMLLGE